jgi:hypothetical protein
MPQGITQDPYELFALGLPPVRYWLQKKLQDARVMGYKTIKFEAEKEETEGQGGGRPSGLSFLPKRRL